MAFLIIALWFLNFKNVWRSQGDPDSVWRDPAWEALKADWEKSVDEIKGLLDQEGLVPSEEEDPRQEEESADLLPLDNDSQAGDVYPIPTYGSPLPGAPSKEPGVPGDSDGNYQGKNCPAWINCMPMMIGPGETPPSQPCSIPPGCEGITELVY